jgi:hypothetical protein
VREGSGAWRRAVDGCQGDLVPGPGQGLPVAGGDVLAVAVLAAGRTGVPVGDNPPMIPARYLGAEVTVS